MIQVLSGQPVIPGPGTAFDAPRRTPEIRIIDRDGLESVSCEDYRLTCAAY
jgi:hypothetical protein